MKLSAVLPCSTVKSVAFWAVSKASKPTLDKDPNVRKYIWRPERFEQMPDDFDAGTHWIVDKDCDRNLLGMDKFTLKLSASTIYTSGKYKKSCLKKDCAKPL